MRIGRADFEAGNLGRAHQAVLDAVPEEEAVEESVLLTAYDQLTEDGKPPFERVLENLAHLVSSRHIGDRTFYIRRKSWLSSAEVARGLGVSKRTVQAWAQEGLLLSQRVGGRLRFAAEAVEERLRGKSDPSKGKTADPVIREVWDNDSDARYDEL